MTKKELNDMMKSLPSQHPHEPFIEKLVISLLLTAFLFFLFRIDLFF